MDYNKKNDHLKNIFLVYVTIYEKTWPMGFFVKVEFDVWLISSTIEVTHAQVSGQSCASFWRYSVLFAIVPHPQKLRNYGPKELLCMRMALQHTTREPESTKWTWPFEMNIKIEQGLKFVLDNNSGLFTDAQKA